MMGRATGLATSVALAMAAMPALAQLQARERFTFDRVVSILYGLAEFLIRAGIVIAFIFIVWYGIQIMLSGDNPGRLTEAKKGIWWAIVGFAVIVGVQVIVATVKNIVDSFG